MGSRLEERIRHLGGYIISEHSNDLVIQNSLHVGMMTLKFSDTCMSKDRCSYNDNATMLRERTKMMTLSSRA